MWECHLSNEVLLPSWFGHTTTGELRVTTGKPSSEWVRVCRRCIYDERVGGIHFRPDGVCSYCEQVESLAERYRTGTAQGESELEKHLSRIRASGKGRRFDCIIGISGGTDSSYLVRMAKREWGLRPLAVHYDNTWNTATATQNIAEVLSTYDVPLHTHVVSHEVADRIFRAFFLVGVPELEASTDLGYAYLLRKMALKYNVNFILEGHSFTSEGVSPLSSNYFDGKYIQSVVQEARRLGLIGPAPRVPKDNRYPLMTLTKFLAHSALREVSFFRPLWYLDYDKESAKRLLSCETGWTDYGGHHLENRMTSFFHSVYLPKKFNVDYRNNALSAAARQGNLDRGEAWKRYCEPPVVEEGLETYFRTRLDLSQPTYDRVMSTPGRTWREFDTYKPQFERLAPVFRYLAERDRVTMSFYLKYCRSE